MLSPLFPSRPFGLNRVAKHLGSLILEYGFALARAPAQ